MSGSRGLSAQELNEFREIFDLVDKDKGVLDESLTDRLRDQAVGFIDFCKALGKSV